MYCVNGESGSSLLIESIDSINSSAFIVLLFNLIHLNIYYVYHIIILYIFFLLSLPTSIYINGIYIHVPLSSWVHCFISLYIFNVLFYSNFLVQCFPTQFNVSNLVVLKKKKKKKRA